MDSLRPHERVRKKELHFSQHHHFLPAELPIITLNEETGPDDPPTLIRRESRTQVQSLLCPSPPKALRNSLSSNRIPKRPTQHRSTPTNRRTPVHCDFAEAVKYNTYFEQFIESLRVCLELPIVSKLELLCKQVTLPPTRKEKTLVLDLDETLIHKVDNFPEAVATVTLPTGEQAEFGVKFRPFLRQFLREANEHFEVGVFTASQQCYADPVLDLIDPEHDLIQFRVYREHCLEVRNRLVKDLRVFVNRRLENLVLVDNSPFSFAYQLNNGIPIPSWYGDSTDEELKKLVVYLQILSRAPDVRLMNQKTFHLHCYREGASQKTLHKLINLRFR